MILHWLVHLLGLLLLLLHLLLLKKCLLHFDDLNVLIHVLLSTLLDFLRHIWQLAFLERIVRLLDLIHQKLDIVSVLRLFTVCHDLFDIDGISELDSLLS